jgi:hypothetical protein
VGQPRSQPDGGLDPNLKGVSRQSGRSAISENPWAGWAINGHTNETQSDFSHNRFDARAGLGAKL